MEPAYPKDNGFSTFCYFNPSLFAHGIPDKTHPAWQAQPSLHHLPMPARPGQCGLYMA